MSDKILNYWYENTYLVHGTDIVELTHNIPATFLNFMLWLSTRENFVINFKYTYYSYEYIGEGDYDTVCSDEHVTFTANKNEVEILLCGSSLKYTSINNLDIHYNKSGIKTPYHKLRGYFVENLNYISELENSKLIPHVKQEILRIINNNLNLINPTSSHNLDSLPRCVTAAQDISFKYSTTCEWSGELQSLLCSIIINEKDIEEKLRIEINNISFLYDYVIHVSQINIHFNKTNKLKITCLFKAECINNELYYQTVGHYKHRINLLRKYPSAEALSELLEELRFEAKSLTYDEILNSIDRHINSLTYTQLSKFL